MKVVILAGGYGTRIGEETQLKPKPMVEVGDKPILWHIMKIYSHYGFNDFIVCLGYKGYMIKEYFTNYFMHQSDVTIDLKNNNVKVHNSKAEPWQITLVVSLSPLRYIRRFPFFPLVGALYPRGWTRQCDRLLRLCRPRFSSKTSEDDSRTIMGDPPSLLRAHAERDPRNRPERTPWRRAASSMRRAICDRTRGAYLPPCTRNHFAAALTSSLLVFLDRCDRIGYAQHSGYA